MTTAEADALIVGAGPAGSATAIGLAKAGWHVTLMEQHPFPRHKVCGECITAGTWTLLDQLDVGTELLERAGPELRSVGWISPGHSFVAPMPACSQGSHRYGHALGRNHLDATLLERARTLGVVLLQPAKLVEVSGMPGCFDCKYETRDGGRTRLEKHLRASVVIDAHGSWEKGPAWSVSERVLVSAPNHSASDLLAFKMRFTNATLANGHLPVIAFPGGYGGMVIAEDGRATLACCIRRDALERCRNEAPGCAAGDAIETYLRRTCEGVGRALRNARHDGRWLSVGPIRPGIRVASTDPILRVGNAAGETHPLIGEGINMALESASLLVSLLGRSPGAAHDRSLFDKVRRSYAMRWRQQLTSRLRISQLYAHAAMTPTITRATQHILTRSPHVLTFAARFAGKARPALLQNSLH